MEQAPSESRGEQFLRQSIELWREELCCRVRDVEVGAVYKGKVTRLMNFGAFVEVLPGKEGLCHISQLAKERVNKVTDILQEGDEVTVKVLEIDKQGKIRLSRKEALGATVPKNGPR